MKMCKWCLEDKDESDFYTYRKNICKDCIKDYNKSYTAKYIPHKPAKNYADYLREAGLTEYCKRYLKNFS